MNIDVKWYHWPLNMIGFVSVPFFVLEGHSSIALVIAGHGILSIGIFLHVFRKNRTGGAG